jgi:hypothetical protein
MTLAAPPVVINDATNIVLLHNVIPPGYAGETPVAADFNTTSGIVVKP